MLAFDAERILFTIPRIDRLSDRLDLCELLLLLDLRDGCGEIWLFAVVGRDSGDLLLGDNRLIHPGDNLSVVDVGVGCMMRSDIEVYILGNV